MGNIFTANYSQFDGRTFAHMACEDDNLDLLRYGLYEYALSHNDIERRRPRKYATEKEKETHLNLYDEQVEKFRIFDILLQRDIHQKTPFHFAFELNNPKTEEFIASWGEEFPVLQPAKDGHMRTDAPDGVSLLRLYRMGLPFPKKRLWEVIEGIRTIGEWHTVADEMADMKKYDEDLDDMLAKKIHTIGILRPRRSSLPQPLVEDEIHKLRFAPFPIRHMT